MNIITIIKAVKAVPESVAKINEALAKAESVRTECESLKDECETIKDGCEGFKEVCESGRDEVDEKLEELEEYRTDCENYKDDCESAKEECEESVTDLGDRLDELEAKVSDILAKLDGLLKSATPPPKALALKFSLKDLVNSDTNSWVEAISWVDERHHDEALRMHGLVPSEMTEEELEEFSCPAELESELTMISNREGYRFYADGTPVTTEGKEG